MAFRRGVAATITFSALDSAGLRATGATLTTYVSQDGGDYVATTNSATEKQIPGPAAAGDYTLTLTAAEMDADLVSVLWSGSGVAATDPLRIATESGVDGMRPANVEAPGIVMYGAIARISGTCEGPAGPTDPGDATARITYDGGATWTDCTSGLSIEASGLWTLTLTAAQTAHYKVAVQVSGTGVATSTWLVPVRRYSHSSTDYPYAAYIPDGVTGLAEYARTVWIALPTTGLPDELADAERYSYGNKCLMIVSGTGAGQLRAIAMWDPSAYGSYPGGRFLLQETWTTQPDATSRLVVVSPEMEQSMVRQGLRDAVTHGDTTWATATGFAVPGSAMTLAADAVNASSLAATAVAEIVAALNNLSSAQAQAACAAALAAYDAATGADIDALNDLSAAQVQDATEAALEEYDAATATDVASMAATGIIPLPLQGETEIVRCYQDSAPLTMQFVDDSGDGINISGMTIYLGIDNAQSTPYDSAIVKRSSAAGDGITVTDAATGCISVEFTALQLAALVHTKTWWYTFVRKTSGGKTTTTLRGRYLVEWSVGTSG